MPFRRTQTQNLKILNELSEALNSTSDIQKAPFKNLGVGCGAYGVGGGLGMAVERRHGRVLQCRRAEFASVSARTAAHDGPRLLVHRLIPEG